jgi:uncharacterized membrane protein
MRARCCAPTKEEAMKGLTRLGILAIAVGAGLASLAGSPAEAFDKSISFCNRTTSDVNVAIGVDFAGTSDTTSKGWYKVRGCTCRSILSGNLRATEIFFLATRSGLDNVLQGGKARLCVHARNGFSYLAENASQASCERAGGAWATFKWYDTGADPTYRLNLRSQGQCNLMGDN